MPRWNILIVTADPHEAQRLHELLNHGDLAVSLAADGESALMCVEAQAPDIILLAARVPGLDAGAVARNLAGRPETASIPVLVLAGAEETLLAAQQLPVETAVLAGADDSELEARVRAHLEASSSRDELEVARDVAERRDHQRDRSASSRRERLERLLAGAAPELAALERGLEDLAGALDGGDPRPPALKAIARALALRAVEARTLNACDAVAPSATLDRFALPTFLRAIVHDLAQRAPRIGGELRVEVDEDLLWVETDPTLLRVVIEGLIATAWVISRCDVAPSLRAGYEGDHLSVRLAVVAERMRETLDPSVACDEFGAWRSALSSLGGEIVIEPSAEGITLGFLMPVTATFAPVS